MRELYHMKFFNVRSLYNCYPKNKLIFEPQKENLEKVETSEKLLQWLDTGKFRGIGNDILRMIIIESSKIEVTDDENFYDEVNLIARSKNDPFYEAISEKDMKSYNPFNIFKLKISIDKK